MLPRDQLARPTDVRSLAATGECYPYDLRVDSISVRGEGRV